MSHGFIGYKSNSIIRGWSTDLANPELAGGLILHKFCTHSKTEIDRFFLSTIVLNPDFCPLPTIELYALDWIKPSRICIQENSNFLKDPVLCEFGYVFDLDCTEKTLRLFAGFGTQPSEGFEDYHWNRYYTNQVTVLNSSRPYIEQYIVMLATMYRCPQVITALTQQNLDPDSWLMSNAQNLEPERYDIILEALKDFIHNRMPQEPFRKVNWQ